MPPMSYEEYMKQEHRISVADMSAFFVTYNVYCTKKEKWFTEKKEAYKGCFYCLYCGKMVDYEPPSVGMFD